MAKALSVEEIAKRAIEATERTQEDLLDKIKRKAKKAEKEAEKPKEKEPVTKQVAAIPKKSAAVITARVDTGDEATALFVESVKDLQLSKDEIRKVSEAFGSFKSNIRYNGIVMKCPGADGKCPHINMCPFREIDRFPEGKLCPIEKMIADRELAEYLKMLHADPNELPLAIINMLFSLVECDLSEIRMRAKLHDEGYIVKKQLFVMSGKGEGEIIEQDDISKAFDIQERVSRRKDILMKSLMLTPEIRKKYNVEEKDTKDISPADAIIIARKALNPSDDKQAK